MVDFDFQGWVLWWWWLWWWFMKMVMMILMMLQEGHLFSNRREGWTHCVTNLQPIWPIVVNRWSYDQHIGITWSWWWPHKGKMTDWSLTCYQRTILFCFFSCCPVRIVLFKEGGATLVSHKLCCGCRFGCEVTLQVVPLALVCIVAHQVAPFEFARNAFTFINCIYIAIATLHGIALPPPF